MNLCVSKLIILGCNKVKTYGGLESEDKIKRDCAQSGGNYAQGTVFRIALGQVELCPKSVRCQERTVRKQPCTKPRVLTWCDRVRPPG